MASRVTRHASRITHYALLLLFLLAVYLLTYTPRINSSDGLAMFATAESMVRRGALDIEQIRWLELQQGTYGLDGLLYSRKGIGVPLGLLPLTWLGLVIPWFGTVGASLLFNAIVTALTGVLLLAYLEALGFSSRTGLMAALSYGLATLAWPYAKSLFSDPFSGLLLLAAAYALLQMSRGAGGQGGRRDVIASHGWAFLAGLLLSWNVATRYAEALFVPVFGLLLLYYLVRGQRSEVRGPNADVMELPETGSTEQEAANNIRNPQSAIRNSSGTSHASHFAHRSSRITHHLSLIIAFTLPLLLTALGLMAFNLSRYGDPLNTGYLPSETFSAVWLDGILGQLISPGRGLLLYAPVLLLSLWGFFPFFRRFRAEALLALSIILIHLLLYGKWFMWHGGYAWGPRFLIPTLPFWALFLAPVFNWTLSKKEGKGGTPPGLRRFFITGMLVISFAIQIPLLLVDFSTYMGWLLDTGLPLFGRETFFQWGYSPWLAVGQFISWNTLDVAWAWGGAPNWPLLAALLANVAVCATALWQTNQPASRQTNKSASRLILVAILTTLTALLLLINHVHQLPAEPLKLAVAALNANVQDEDAVITNDPELTAPFAERYKGRAPVLGLNVGGFPLPEDINRRLKETIAAHRQIWWLPNWLPPEQSAIEQTLLAEMVRVRNEDFDGQRLALFAQPPAEAHAEALEVRFGEEIELAQATIPPEATAGSAYTVAVTWTALTSLETDYHVFVHLETRQGERIAQSDGQPAQWTRPTSTWQVGEPIVDRHGLWIPADAPPGDYRLRLGLYDPTTGQRLLLPDGNDTVSFLINSGAVTPQAQ